MNTGENHSESINGEFTSKRCDFNGNVAFYMLSTKALQRAPKSWMMILKTLVGPFLLACLCILFLAYVGMTRKDISTSLVVNKLVRNVGHSSRCKGYFYLCRLKQMLDTYSLYYTHSKIFALHEDIFNISGLYSYNSIYFKNRSNADTCSAADTSVRLDMVYEMRRSLLNKYANDLFFVNTVEYVFLEERNAQDMYMCSYGPGNFAYSTHCHALSSVQRPNHTGFGFSFIECAIKETYKGGHYPSAMSNIFGRVYSTHTLTNCEPFDYTEGTYFLSCRVLHGQKNTTIDIYGSYVPSNQYHFQCMKKDMWLINKIRIEDIFNYDQFGPRDLQFPVCSDRELNHAPGHWQMIKGVGHWVSKCYFSYNLSIRHLHCLYRKPIILIGDSHMRERFHPLAKYMNHISQYFYSTVPSHLMSLIDNYAVPFLNVYEDGLVVLNSGHWSLRQLNIMSYVSEMRELFDLIYNLRRRFPNNRFIWIEITAVAYDSWHLRWIQNPEIAAMNTWVNHNMENLGVEILHAYDISIAMESYAKDGVHYHVLIGDDAYKNNQIVNVGGAIASVLVNMICRDF